MKVKNDLRFIELDYHAKSLYDVIADNKYRSTTASRSTWESLVAHPSLQLNCNKRGFNVEGEKDLARVRIGIIANQENYCDTADSFIGFGSSYTRKKDELNSCGNMAYFNPENGARDTKAMGYIFVRN